ncbi:MAG TPA: recombination protein NinG [Flavobacterium sp.]
MAKKCKYCGNHFTPKYSSFEKYCQSDDCRYKFAMEELAKKKAKQEKEKMSKYKDNTTNWKNRLQTEINTIVRAIDKGLPCLAKKRFGQIHAGHVFGRGSNTTIRFNLHNIHRQNAQSNHFQNDDGLLREGLTNEYGQEYMTFVSELRQTPALTYKDKEFKEFTEKAHEIAKRLLKLDLEYSLKIRIMLRNKINQEIGIYTPEFCVFSNINNIANISNNDNIGNTSKK